MTLPSDLVEVISVWANLPDSIKIGIVAMVKAAFESAGGNPSRSSAAISSLLKDLPEIP